MPCYDPRDRFSYHDDQSSDLRHTIRELQDRNTKMTRILCDIGHMVERRPLGLLADIKNIRGYEEWWREHQLVDSLREKAEAVMRRKK